MACPGWLKVSCQPEDSDAPNPKGVYRSLVLGACTQETLNAITGGDRSKVVLNIGLLGSLGCRSNVDSSWQRFWDYE